MSDDISRVLSSIPVEGYISRFVSLKKRGTNFWGLCPFHAEQTPSFSVSPGKGIFKCFGCGKGGNIISFVQQYQNTDFKDALKILADYAGITLTRHQRKKSQQEKRKKDILIELNMWVSKLYGSQISHEIPRNYLEGRDIEMAEYFSVGYAPNQYRFLENALQKSFSEQEKKEALEGLHKLGLIVPGQRDEDASYNRFKGRLIFPIQGTEGEVIAFGGRSLESNPKMAKYVNSPESELFKKKFSLYNFHRARDTIRANNLAILVEGYLDVIGLCQKKIGNVVAPLGTAFTKEQARLLKRYTDNLIIFFDSDKAGIEAAYKAIQTARWEGLQVKVVSLLKEADKGKDPFDLSSEKDEVELLSLLDSANNETEFVFWYLFSYKNNIEETEEKKQAIEQLFEYTNENMAQLWEKLDFIEKAGQRLQVSSEVLKFDFKKFLKDSRHSKTSYNVPTKNIPEPKGKIPRYEKDILAMLLRFPELWENEILLEEVEWGSEDMYLLFNFFRDRLTSGEIWDWEHLNEAISLLPTHLAEVLSEIIMEFDEILNSQDEATNYSYHLKKTILRSKFDEIQLKIKEAQQKLGTSSIDSSESNDSLEELTLEIQELLEKKKKVHAALN